MTKRIAGDGLAREAERLLHAVRERSGRAWELALWMAAHPERALEERETQARYCAWLEEAGFEVVRGVAGLATAFVARRSAPGARWRVALLAEMDALPELGHACGHNLAGPASLLAAVALAEALEPPAAELLVVGCPAEEIGRGKRALLDAGVFRGVDVALMAHPASVRRAHRLFLGNRKFVFRFRGRAAHAAAAPEKGVNALDALIQLFVAIGLLRQQLPSAVRVHGIVTEGGHSPNVIPERATARVWVRAPDFASLELAVSRVLEAARGAARAAGAEVAIEEEEGSSPPFLPNHALAALYRRQLARLGLEESQVAPDAQIGSSDVSHLSWALPTLHPNFPIGEGLALHTREFAAAAASEAGRRGLIEAASALALTVLELARSPEARAAIRREFEARRAGEAGAPRSS